MLHRRRRAAGLHHRLLRGVAAVLPRRRHRRPGRQRHRQRPGHVRGPAAVPVGRVHPGGGLPGRRPGRGSSRSMAARRRRPPGSRSSPATPRWSQRGKADGCYINTAGVGVIERAVRARARPRSGPATRCWCPGRSATTASPSCWPGASSTSRPTCTSDTAPLTAWSPRLLDAAPGRALPARRHPGRGGHHPQRDRPRGRGRRGRRRGGGAGARRGARRLRAARHRPAVRRLRGPAGGGRRRRRRPTRPWPRCAPTRWAQGAADHRPGQGRPAGPGAARRPRSAAPASSTCWSATRCRASADRRPASRASAHRVAAKIAVSGQDPGSDPRF